MTSSFDSRTVIFALGANLGSSLDALQRAARALDDAMAATRASGVYRTPPEGGADQPDYLNAVVRGEAPFTPSDALELAARLEREAGRVRTSPGASRVLDVDVLFVNGDVVDEPHLKVPHPRWAGRDFVVVPLMDVASDWTDPRTGRTVAQVAEDAGWRGDRFPLVLEPGALLSREDS